MKFVYIYVFCFAFQEELCETIIEAYVKDLIRDKRRDLIAFYVSKLSPPAQVLWYAKFLEGKFFFFYLL